MRRMNQQPRQTIGGCLVIQSLEHIWQGTTQRKMQDRYSVKAKQLAACITGRKYLGGMDRKRRLSGQDEGASTSKKPALK